MNEHMEYLIQRLHQVFDSEQKERHNGGFGVPTPFNSIEDTIYGQVIEELRRLSDENENLKQTLYDGNIEREKVDMARDN